MHEGRKRSNRTRTPIDKWSLSFTRSRLMISFVLLERRNSLMIISDRIWYSSSMRQWENLELLQMKQWMSSCPCHASGSIDYCSVCDSSRRLTDVDSIWNLLVVVERSFQTHSQVGKWQMSSSTFFFFFWAEDRRHGTPTLRCLRDQPYGILPLELGNFSSPSHPWRVLSFHMLNKIVLFVSFHRRTIHQR